METAKTNLEELWFELCCLLSIESLHGSCPLEEREREMI